MSSNRTKFVLVMERCEEVSSFRMASSFVEVAFSISQIDLENLAGQRLLGIHCGHFKVLVIFDILRARLGRKAG